MKDKEAEIDWRKSWANVAGSVRLESNQLMISYFNARMERSQTGRRNLVQRIYYLADSRLAVLVDLIRI